MNDTIRETAATFGVQVPDVEALRVRYQAAAEAARPWRRARHNFNRAPLLFHGGDPVHAGSVAEAIRDIARRARGIAMLAVLCARATAGDDCVGVQCRLECSDCTGVEILSSAEHLAIWLQDAEIEQYLADLNARTAAEFAAVREEICALWPLPEYAVRP